MADEALTLDQMLALAAKHWSTADVVSVSRELAKQAGLSDSQYDEMIRPGGNDPRLTISVVNLAVEIAWYESNWIPTKHNPIPPDNSYGLWQINMLGDLGKNRRDDWDISNEDLYDPDINARCAHSVWEQNRGFQGSAGWSTSYIRAVGAFLNGTSKVGAGAAITGNASEAGLYPGQLQLEGAAGNAISGIIDWGSAIVSLIRKLMDPNFWLRIGIGMIGAVVLVVALVLMFKNSDTGQELQKQATDVAMMVATKGAVK